MFSSSNNRPRPTDPSGPNYPTQWALNPSAYQNVSSENVDWAALAQQWIMMKESAPPPEPTKKDVEGGEAPMDVENEKDESSNDWPEGNSSSGGVTDWNWQQQWSTWPATWNGPPPGVPATAPLSKTALLPTPYHFPSDVATTPGADFPSYDTVAGNVSAPDFHAAANTSGYWTNSGISGRGKHPVKGGRVPRKTSIHETRPELLTADTVTLDAARRRQLPAWIREGLEKMEREKQKQLDREREKIEREEYLSRKKEEVDGALELLKEDNIVLPSKSKFDSDSADSDEEERSNPQLRRRPMATSQSNSPPVVLTEEERMAMVRRAMTEVLLQVTSSEILTICQEEVNRMRARLTASAKKGGRPAATGIPAVGSLGLGIYGGDSSDSEIVTPPRESDREATPKDEDTDPGLISRRQIQQKEITKRRRTEPDLGRTRGSSEARDTSNDNGRGGHDSQVDTARPHGTRRQQRSTSSSTSTSSSDTSSRKKRKKPPVKEKRRKEKSSSSENDDDDSSSDTKSSDSQTSRDTTKKKSSRRRSSKTPEQRKSRSRSESSSNDKRHKVSSRSRRSRSVDRSRRSRSIEHASTSSRRRSRSRSDDSRSRESRFSRRRRHSSERRRDRSRSRSRRRESTRSRRSRSRDDRRSRSREERRYRSRSREQRRGSYRRRTTRTRSRSRSHGGHGGGKRTRGH